MTQIKKFQNAPSALPAPRKEKKKSTYYDDGVVYKTSVNNDNGKRYVQAAFVTPRGEYNVDTYTWNDGKNRRVAEYGDSSGVAVDIINDYGPDGMVQKSDTTYNGLRRGDIGYEHLQRQFENGYPEPVYQGVPDDSTRISPWKIFLHNIGKRLGFRKQGGKLNYLDLF